MINIHKRDYPNKFTDRERYELDGYDIITSLTLSSAWIDFASAAIQSLGMSDQLNLVNQSARIADQMLEEYAQRFINQR